MPEAGITVLFQPDRTRRVEVVVQLVGNILNYLLRLYAVSRLVQWRRKHSDRALARGDSHDPTTNSALRWKAHTPSPAPGAVIKASHDHGAKDVRNTLLLNHLLAGGGVDTVVRERGAHASKLDSVHAN